MNKAQFKLRELSRLDRDVAQIVSENGVPDTVAALARYCDEVGRKVAARRLYKLYGYLTGVSK